MLEDLEHHAWCNCERETLFNCLKAKVRTTIDKLMIRNTSRVARCSSLSGKSFVRMVLRRFHKNREAEARPIWKVGNNIHC